jgi:hypothetical protein
MDEMRQEESGKPFGSRAQSLAPEIRHDSGWKIGGEITTESQSPLSGEWRTTVSGMLVAATREAASNRLDSLLSSEGPDADITRRWSETYLDASGTDATPKRTLAKLDFTCSTRLSRTRTVVEYTDATEWDHATLQQTRTMSGTVWAATEEQAEAAIAGLGMTTPARESRSHTKVIIDGTRTQWIKLDFSQAATTWMTGRAAYDLREASSSVETTASYQATVVTQIPFGNPVIQRNVGLVPGRITASASAKALSAQTATAWVTAALQAAGAAAGSGKYILDPQRITQSEEKSLSANGVLDETLHGASGSVSWGV